LVAGIILDASNDAVMSEFLPGHARDRDGMLTIGGMRADELAKAHGTPLLVIDLATLNAHVDALRNACEPHGVRISYAAKALLVVALARRLAARGLDVDICSLGELATVERAGIAAARITFHGAGKTDEELQAALDGRVGRVVIDNLSELERLRALPSEAPLDVALRLNLGIEAHTHDFVRTAGDDSKFGLAPHELAPALDMLKSASSLRLRGLHSHIGSQIYESSPFAANAELLVAAMERVVHAGFAVDTLIVGGGFGIRMHPRANDESIDIRATVDGIARSVRSAVDARKLEMPKIEIEPGRAIVGNAGTSLYRVMAVKRYDVRTFVVVDGSLADNPRPALYDAEHHVIAASSAPGELHEVTVCGRSCENDELAKATLPVNLAAGDLLAFASTGAYTYSMASNYNRFPRPPIVAVGEGNPRLLARRESIEDILRNDVDA
jgi:diaminopimelate decarboxylase